MINWAFFFGGLFILAHLLVVIRMSRKHPGLRLDEKARAQAKAPKRWIFDPAFEAIGDSYLVKVVWVRQISATISALLIAAAFLWAFFSA